MADDIVTERVSHPAGCTCLVCLMGQEIERLRAAGDALVEAHADDLCDCYQPECVAIRAAHDAWEEARRD
jgi:hypothetical protein